MKMRFEYVLEVGTGSRMEPGAPTTKIVLETDAEEAYEVLDAFRTFLLLAGYPAETVDEILGLGDISELDEVPALSQEEAP